MVKKLLFLLFALFLVACTQTENPATVACTLDAKICPDGSAVGRVGPNCEFEACPVSDKKVCASDEKECSGGLMVSRNPENNCEFDACPAVVNEDFSVTYANGKLTYSAKIDKPTPCHMLDIKQQFLESYPVQVVITAATVAPEEGIMCAQVETQEIVQGYVVIDHKPGSIKIVVDGKEIYSTAEID